MESLNSNSKERELHPLQQMQDKAMESCMTFLSSLFLFDNEEGLMICKYFIAYTKTDVPLFHDKLFQHMESLQNSIQERAKHKRKYDKRMDDRMIQSKEGKVDSRKALDAGLVVTESIETESERHVLSNRSENDTHIDDADINSVNDKQPMAKVDRNTIPKSTYMSHRGGEIDQNADAKKYQVSCPLLDPSFDNITTKFSNQFLESENISLKKTVSQLQKVFLRMEAHYVNMELKYQNQVLKNGQHGQILNETSNEANIKREIDVLETRNIKLESSVARLLANNEKLNKENEHLKQTYKDLSDSIKKTSVQTKDHADSLIVQLNYKSVENADLKDQIQEKVFANATLKNKLIKIKGTSVDTKLEKSSTMGKPVLQPHKNQSVVSQLTLIKDHVLEKPHHMIAPGSSRNSFKESYASINMTHKYYLEEAKKKTQERDRKSTTSVMPSAKLQDTTKSCKLKPKSNNQTSRSFPTSKSSCPSITTMPKVPTGKKFTYSTTKVDCEPLNGSTEDITNPYECNQTLNVSAENNSEASSFSDVIPTIMQTIAPNLEHVTKWTKDHLLDNIISELERFVSIRLQLHEQALFCYYDAFLTLVKPKNYKDVLTQACWIEAMQEELNEFEHLEVWELVPRPDKVMVITLKWIYKVKLDELGGILKNKARLVARGYRQEEGIDFEESFALSEFSKGIADPTLFIRRQGKDILLVQICVDDIIFAPRGIFLNQSKYALESLKKYGMEFSNPVDTPMVEKSKLDEDTQGKAVDPTHYRGMVDTLMYLTASRPDLTFVVCMCARYQDSSIALTAYADADSEGLTDYGLGFNKILMYCDNKSAIALCCNKVQHSQSKHIDIKFNFIKEQVENGVVELYFVNTEYQLADIFTKALGRERIEFLINKLGIMSETLKQLAEEAEE
ncbi:integrase, catalytic region, zinc finger, CCHC-type containing protein [Tanacetum coccineum]